MDNVIKYYLPNILEKIKQYSFNKELNDKLFKLKTEKKYFYVIYDIEKNLILIKKNNMEFGVCDFKKCKKNIYSNKLIYIFYSDINENWTEIIDELGLYYKEYNLSRFFLEEMISTVCKKPIDDIFIDDISVSKISIDGGYGEGSYKEDLEKEQQEKEREMELIRRREEHIVHMDRMNEYMKFYGL